MSPEMYAQLRGLQRTAKDLRQVRKGNIEIGQNDSALKWGSFQLNILEPPVVIQFLQLLRVA